MHEYWFNRRKDGVRYTKLKAPYDNLSIGSDPYSDGMTLATSQRFDVFINLTENPLYTHDTHKPQQHTRYYWVPIWELEPWGYEPFLETKKLLDEFYTHNNKVYMHCAAGTNRAPCITMAWLLSKNHPLEEAASIISSNDAHIQNYMRKYMLNIKQGLIPKDLKQFIEKAENLLSLDTLIE